MKKQVKDSFIIGAGVTGLATGFASGLPVYEANDVAGGICTSYYMKPGNAKRMFAAPRDGNAYHFETGGGHWIFGGSDEIKKFIKKLSPYNVYERKSSVYLPDSKLFVPYPLQNNLAFLDKKTSDKAVKEILHPNKSKVVTMKEWNEHNFGKTLSEIFFNPFHELYTARLYSKIAPQDNYKSPIDKDKVLGGYKGKKFSVGYNATFIYPRKGLDSLARKLAEKCNIHYNKKIVKINLKNKEALFADGSSRKFNTLVSTLPLNKMTRMAGISAGKAFPSPSVLVVNIGAKKGPACPSDQWVYIPKSRSGFHRVGFYSNVDRMFLPKKHRKSNGHVSVYVERAYPDGFEISKKEMTKVSRQIIKELQDWQWIGKVDVFDPTWIETAYTWSWPDSLWKEKVLAELEKHGIIQIGRYGKWVFQGIADSISDGLKLGREIK